MTEQSITTPVPAGEKVETTLAFLPQFGPDGLIPAIVTNRQTGEVLMFAHMNAEALRQTIASGIAHFWSRSRDRLWKKGEESGNLLEVAEIRTDCDQDVLWLVADVAGDGVACHTGARSCFYRRLAAAPEAAIGARLEIAALPPRSDAD